LPLLVVLLLQEQHHVPPVVALHGRVAPDESVEPLLVHPSRETPPPRRERWESKSSVVRGCEEVVMEGRGDVERRRDHGCAGFIGKMNDEDWYIKKIWWL
jgi:hypothetical protein